MDRCQTGKGQDAPILWHCAGICLAEFLIAMTAGAVVLATSVQTLHHFRERLQAQHGAFARHQDLGIGLSVMEAELRSAGTGTPLSAAVLQAGREEVVFLSNLEGLTTMLTEAVSANQLDLKVKDGADWPNGKRVVICGAESCGESRLAGDGRQRTLVLTGPLGQTFPAGSVVSLSNQVRYYLGRDQRNKSVLMRQVDGGANPLVGDIARFRLVYLDRQGSPTQDAAHVARVRVEIAVEDDGLTITKDVVLRAR